MPTSSSVLRMLDLDARTTEAGLHRMNCNFCEENNSQSHSSKRKRYFWDGLTATQPQPGGLLSLFEAILIT
ncbi:hypothetical protein Plhal304r1_c011g0042291 [Plasmopara halstedii]